MTIMGLSASFVSAGPFGSALNRPASEQKSQKFVHSIAVFGKDNRAVVPRRHRRTSKSIGLLFNNRTSTACTAFCVAPSTIATAAHCLFKINSGRSPRMRNFTFARRYSRIREYTKMAGSGSYGAQNVMAGSMRLSVRPPIDATGDWTFIRLARPVCKNRSLRVKALSTTALIKAAKANRIYQLAYHRDFAHWRMAYSKPCRIKRDFKNAKWKTIRRDFSNANRLILHTCDTGGASSGSPILMSGPNGPTVVGINVGTYIQSNALVQNGKITRRYKASTVANTAVSAAAFYRQLAIFLDAKILKTAKQIRQLQAGLQRLSLYHSSVDGLYGRLTHRAIIAFENINGLPVTGLASRDVLKRVLATPGGPRRRAPHLTTSYKRSRSRL